MENNTTVYVLCPENDKASGGIKILYRHVDVLNRYGFSAAILHQQHGFRCSWFENTTRIAYLPDVQLTADDYLLIPEIYGPNILSLSDLEPIGHDVRKVIFNQNCRYTFLGQTLDSIQAPDFSMPYRLTDEYVATIVVSEDSQAYLEYVFPGIDIYRIHNAINVDRFSFQAEKQRQLCYMPRKHPDDAVQVLAILRTRGVLEDVRVVAIDNMHESEVAEVMKASQFFLSFGYPEGCPLPPAEAMACGCIVIGYHGFGGKEYFRDEFSYPVDVGDITGYASVVESLLKELADDPRRISHQGRLAADWVREHYSPDREKSDILACWTGILGTVEGE